MHRYMPFTLYLRLLKQLIIEPIIFLRRFGDAIYILRTSNGFTIRVWQINKACNGRLLR